MRENPHKINMQSIRITILFLLLSLLAACEKPQAEGIASSPHAAIAVSNQGLINAFTNKQSHVQIEGNGTIKKLLAEDNKGARHQKFLVSISPDQTLLFAHNIDLAPRVEGLKVGETVQFKGEYIYNPKGGIVHWTHHDPSGQHPAGWIQYEGKTYQ